MARYLLLEYTRFVALIFIHKYVAGIKIIAFWMMCKGIFLVHERIY